jgi:hypothetical protein
MYPVVKAAHLLYQIGKEMLCEAFSGLHLVAKAVLLL